MSYQETPDIVTSSEEYARRFSGKIGEWFLKVQEEATLRMLSSYPGATVLDVGGGHGQIAKPLSEHGYKVTVLGSSEVCKERIIKLIENNLCEFKTGNILNIPYTDRSFDTVITFRQMAHVRNWKGFIKELTRVARKAVILDYPALRSLNYVSYIFPSSFKVKKGLEADTRPYTLFKEPEILEIFSANGFKYSERFPQFFLPMFFHRRLKFYEVSMPVEKIFRILGITGLFGSPVILKMVRRDSE